MADPIITDVRRTIYESFWRSGKLPLSKSIETVGLNSDGSAKVKAVCYDIPEELLGEHTIEDVQERLDALAFEPSMKWPSQ